MSDQLDEVEEASPAKKRKGRSTAAAKAKAKKKAKEDGDYEGSSEDEYTAISKSMRTMGGNGDSKPPVGSFEKCARCEKQFTVVIMVEFILRLDVTSLFFFFFFVPRRDTHWQRIRHPVIFVTSVRKRLGQTRLKNRPLRKRENRQRKNAK